MADLKVRSIVCDRALNPILEASSGRILVVPDSKYPALSAFMIRNFSHVCLHESVASVLSPLVERQSVGLESPITFVRRNFKRCLHLLASNGTIAQGSTRGAGGGESYLSPIDWDFIQEAYGVQCDMSSPPLSASLLPDGLTDSDHWELLLLAAALCAKLWFQMK